MSSKLQVIFRNLHAWATVTATSEAMPITHTQNSERSEIWRSTDNASQTINATLNVVSPANAIALLHTNFSAATRIQITLHQGGTPVYDSGALLFGKIIPVGVFRVGIDPWLGLINLRNFILDLPAVNFDAYTIVLNDSRADPFEIGQIVVGEWFRPTYNFDIGRDLEYVDGVEHRRSAGGSLFSEQVGESYRRLRLRLSELSETEMTRLIDESGIPGRAQDIFIDAKPAASDAQRDHHQMMARRMNTLQFRDRKTLRERSDWIFEEI